MLTCGKGPELEVAELDGIDRNNDGTPDDVNGIAYPIRNGKGLIEIDDTVVGMFENA